MPARKRAKTPAALSPLLPLPSVDVRASGVHGLGAFATRAIAKGEVIGFYGGRRVSAAEQAGREWDHVVTYVFGLSDGTLIDGGDGGNATRHINHSCAPNCQAFEITSDTGVIDIQIEARRRLKIDDELSIDYQLDIADGDPADYPCRCGAKRCRGTLAAG